ncbi:MAG: hypothetical protein ACOVLK_06200, partial [Terrimicrobiaceae bacterium]
MKVSDINSKTLIALLSLTKKKESLLAKAAEVERQIASLASGEVLAATRVIRESAEKKRRGVAKNKNSKGIRSPKGLIKEQVTRLLSAAGEIGVSAKEIAQQID